MCSKPPAFRVLEIIGLSHYVQLSRYNLNSIILIRGGGFCKMIGIRFGYFASDKILEATLSLALGLTSMKIRGKIRVLPSCLKELQVRPTLQGPHHHLFHKRPRILKRT